MPDNQNQKPEQVRPNQNPAATPNANPGPATTGGNRTEPAQTDQGPNPSRTNSTRALNQAVRDPAHPDATDADEAGPASQTPRDLDDGWRADWSHDDLENQEAVPDNRDPDSPEMQSLQNTAEQNRLQAEDEAEDALSVAVHLRTSGQIMRPRIRNIQLVNGFVILTLDEHHSVAFPSSEVSRIDMENSRY